VWEGSTELYHTRKEIKDEKTTDTMLPGMSLFLSSQILSPIVLYWISNAESGTNEGGNLIMQ
jgi:membrane protein insertase Oxa1/YidC/SpoIIIJ